MAVFSGDKNYIWLKFGLFFLRLLTLLGGTAATSSSPGKQFLGGDGNAVVASGDVILSPGERNALQLECQSEVQSFIQEATAKIQGTSSPDAVRPNPEDMLFFLHVPRTAGRTFFSCFMKQATPPSKRCAKSYDTLRLNVSYSGCGLLSSHDDYSVSEFLPETAAIVTQIRDPVDRFLSAYEFSVEVAARDLQRSPNATKQPPPPDSEKINTRNVWPWSLLVPFMEADMRARVARHRHETARSGIDVRKRFVEYTNATVGRTYYHSHAARLSKWELSEGDELVPPLDPYNNPLVMPLRDFIEHPIARKTLHNGAALQVLGLTNYSHNPLTPKLRRCIDGLPAAREAMAKVALGRLRGMYHIGVTDRLEESVASAAAALGIKLGGPSWKSKADGAFAYEEGEEEAAPAAEGEGAGNSTGAPDEAEEGVEEDFTAAREEYQRRIDEATRELNSKLRELRNTRTAIRTAEFKAQTVPVGAGSVRPGDELRGLKAKEQQLEKGMSELKGEVADLQVLMMRLKTEPPVAQPRAVRIVKEDSAFLNPGNLTATYHKCVVASRGKNNMRWKSLAGLRTTDGRPFHFSYEARSRLNPSIINRIRQLNSMDVRLYGLAKQLLSERTSQQAADGLLEVMPRPPRPNNAGSRPPLPPLPQPEGEEEGEPQDAPKSGAAAEEAGLPNGRADGGLPRGGEHAEHADGGREAAAGGGRRVPIQPPRGLNRAPKGPMERPQQRRPGPGTKTVDFREWRKREAGAAGEAAPREEL